VQTVAHGVSVHLSSRPRERNDQHGLAGSISNLDSHVVEGSRRQVIPQVAKLAGHSHGLGAGFGNVGQLRPYVVSVETVAVVDVKIVLGYTKAKPRGLTKAKASLGDLCDGSSQIPAQKGVLDANGITIVCTDPLDPSPLAHKRDATFPQHVRNVEAQMAKD
jgi:hypothetical protein